DYNIYNNTFVTTPPTTTQVIQAGVDVTGRSVLPLNNVTNAYPLSGTAFMFLYSCYNVQTDANRVTNLRNFLNWYINAAEASDPDYDAKVSQVIENNGFHHISVNYKANIITQYLTSTNSGFISGATASSSGGCTGVAGGASGGAK